MHSGVFLEYLVVMPSSVRVPSAHSIRFNIHNSKWGQDNTLTFNKWSDIHNGITHKKVYRVAQNKNVIPDKMQLFVNRYRFFTKILEFTEIKHYNAI